MSLVSIILPTYNRIKFLPSAFTSLLQQTHQEWELIIVDDGSNDIVYI
jgi:glycosyltransferase involved in cell wall biosynthesis